VATGNAGGYFEWVVELTRGQLLDLILAVEERLRGLVRDVLRAAQHDWEALIPRKIRESAHGVQGKAAGDILAKATLGQLTEIVVARWSLFENLIPLTQEEFRVKANDFREWRNFLAHGNLPSQDQKVEIAVAIRQVGERIPVVDDSPGLLGVGTSVRGKSVLWVDDHPEWTLGERELLTALGIEVVPAITNDEAVHLANARQFDLVVSDIEHGDAEGGDLLPRRLHALGLESPVLFYVGRVDPNRPPPAGARAITNDPAIVIRDALQLLTQE
jgi:CheY-like chemotaxis protein